MTKTDQVVKFIKSAGPDGLTFSEIQRFIVEDFQGLDYDERETGFYGRQRVHRGWWCVPLCNNIFPNYCFKKGKKWVHNDFK